MTSTINIDMYDKLKTHVLMLESALQEKTSLVEELERSKQHLQKDVANLRTVVQCKESEVEILSHKVTALENELRTATAKVKTLEQKVSELSYHNIELSNTIEVHKQHQHDGANPLHQEQLMDTITELEVIKAKLAFDNSVLTNKIEELRLHQETTAKLSEYVHSNELTHHKAIITQLQQSLTEIEQTSLKPPSQVQVDSTLLIEQITTLQNQIQQLNEENFVLHKENQELKFKQSEGEIVTKHMEEFISSLQTEYEEGKDNHERVLSETKLKLENIEQELVHTQQQSQLLLNERDIFAKQNEEYKNEFRKVNHEIQLAKDISTEKIRTLEQTVKEYQGKVKEYKVKVVSLKTKIKELYSIISDLKLNDKHVYEQLNSVANATALKRNKCCLANGVYANANTAINNNNRTRDPLEQHQHKQLNEYKRLLNNIDTNLKNYTSF